MHIKDYYSILQIAPSATQQEIKKAYRRLAQQIHPDKNNSNPYSNAQFAEVKEAYEVLTNPTKKEYYLQQRWYNQSIGKRKVQEIVTPENILKQVLELEKYVAGIDVFRMDKKGLQEYICEILNDSTLATLNTFNDINANNEIAHLIIKAANPLPYSYLHSIEKKLESLHTGASTKALLSVFIQKHKTNNRKKNLEVWVALVIAIAICMLIYFMS